VKDSLNVPYVFFTSQGREKNPQFIEQVAAHFDKQDNIVVVLLMIYPFLFRSIVFIGHGLCVFFF
jgi:predicted lactoylglutathione lyase